MDLIHKQQVALLQIVQDRSHLTGLLDSRSAGDLQMNSHLVGNDPGESRLAKTGRSIEKNMVQGVSTLFRSLNIYLQIFFDLGLTDIVIKDLRTKGTFDFHIFLCKVRLNDAFCRHSENLSFYQAKTVSSVQPSEPDRNQALKYSRWN